MPESELHLELRTLLYQLLKDYLGDGATVGSDQFVYYDASDPKKVVAPDVYVQLRPPTSKITSWKVWERGAPDIAVEIFSPTNQRRRGDFQRRVRDWLDAGVRLLWVIYPDAEYAMAHRPDGSARMVREFESLEGEDVLPGFRMDLGELFRAMPG